MNAKQFITQNSAGYVVSALLFITWVFCFMLLELGLLIHGVLLIAIVIFGLKLRKDFSREQRLLAKYNLRLSGENPF